MDTRVKALWLDALRSGEYEQAKEVLAKVDPETGKVGYCCLGVLCDLAVKEGVIPSPVLVDRYENGGEASLREKDRYLYGDPDGPERSTSTAELPVAVKEWAGLYDTSPAVDGPNPDYVPDQTPEEEWDYEPETLTYGLAELNDDHDKNFDEIADLIEAGL